MCLFHLPDEINEVEFFHSLYFLVSKSEEEKLLKCDPLAKTRFLEQELTMLCLFEKEKLLEHLVFGKAAVKTK